MKTYDIEKEQTDLFERHGAFFAFTNKTVAEKSKKGVEYYSLGMGLICPKENCQMLYKEMNELEDKKIAWELNHNTKKEIIWYNLANHECQITWDTTNVVENLEDYGITKEEVNSEFRPYCDYCSENNYY